VLKCHVTRQPGACDVISGAEYIMMTTSSTAAVDHHANGSADHTGSADQDYVEIERRLKIAQVSCCIL